MIEFKLPAIGEGVVEVEIVRWLKQPGETVAHNEALIEVMTDKATVEIPSPHEGTIEALLAPEGATVGIGQPICTLVEQDGEASNDPPPRPRSFPPPSPVVSVAPVPDAEVGEHGSTQSPTTGRVLATPAARALARESGIDLSDVEGRNGRITKADVERARARGADVEPPPARARIARAAPPPDTIPFRGIRKATAQAMVDAYHSAIHYTYVDEVNVTQLVAVREQAKRAAADDGVKLTYLPFIVKAVVRGLKKFPIVNARLDEAAGEIRLFSHYDIGIATNTERGLMVPVLRGADTKSLLDVAAEIHELSEGARQGRLSRDEMRGSTFTVTSLGTVGGLHATPILNPPEVGILGVHAIRKVPLVDDRDHIVVGRVMNLSVSLDHRVVDGFEGASFLQEVKRYLEDPTLLLLAGI